MSGQFDLIEYEKYLRECFDAGKVFSIWNEVCVLREKRSISEYEWTQIGDIVKVRLEDIARVKIQVESTTAGGETAK